MVKFYVLLLWLVLAFGSYSTYAQAPMQSEVEEDLELALEDYDPSDPESENETLIQYLQDLAANPVNINTAEIDDLLEIPAMNLQLAHNLVAYRKRSKPFESIQELIEVDGIGKSTVEQLSPYMTVGSGIELKRSLYTDYRYWTHQGKLEIFSRYQRTLEQQEGYRRPPVEGGYLGKPFKYYQRLRYRSSHLSMNLTQEQDPGEPLGGELGLDFYSGHLALTDNGKLREFIVGDYGLSFGQGLVFGGGGAFGKGRDISGSINRNERGVYPYTSAQETDFYRGIAATYGDKLQVTGFYSRRNRSASEINGDTLRYPRSDGYHRTINERAIMNNLAQETYGGRIRGTLPFGLIGVSGYKLAFSKYINSGDALYNRYDFRGISSSSFGMDYKFLFGPVQVFGEAARSENGGYGIISGLESTIAEDTDMVVAYRKYAKDFHALLGSGFGEASGGPQNEKGIYLGLQHVLNSWVTLSAYFDQFWFPEPRFGTGQATQGFDWLIYTNFRLSPRLQFYLQVRSDLKEDEYEGYDQIGRSVRKLGANRRRSVRGQLEYQVNGKIRIRTRAEIVQSGQAGEKEETGYLLFQDVRVVPAARWKVDLRATVFETASYNSRVYQFENDLLYVMSNEMLYGSGQRLYLLLNLEPLPFLELWAKFGLTIYEDQLTVGSGLNEIIGNRRSELGVQARFQF